MKFVYIAGPYTGNTHDYRSYFEIERHIQIAVEASAELAELGVGFFCPHNHSAHFELITPKVKPSFWYALDMHFLAACDAMLLLPGWQNSKGVKKELAVAGGKPVFKWPTERNKLVVWAKP